ncbi:photosystem II oxygen evolving complex protein PsbP [Aphanothece hegewaldii CCALA 016]|uniref:Photosystem II oxygen evolving complex protein PsbP n=1 Tax=Aphanothece hegewaldii CCALA 016 TaxID=2107694 RepID=A0A2T1LZI1_9CHRO|nr:photosystem II reaction center PsbP [Aphanothece hegewaldii]PSF37834.1 photosystem II oxygen evolving complex protein PsbP [Aphanothece hegewaldii CCALA 016]
MYKSIVAILLIIVSFMIVSCSPGISNLQSYVNNKQGYGFFYPNGWIPVDVQNASEGVDTVFRDFIERSENLSVIISSVDKNQRLADLGSATDVGYHFLRRLNDDPNVKRDVELLQADTLENKGKTYYILEYLVQMPNKPPRHELASVTINNGKLYTFSLSTPQRRWEQVKTLFSSVANSFFVY